MAHGQPDWGSTAPKDRIFSLGDLGELAARLGSLHVHDRRGDLFFADRFDGGASKVVAYSSAGNSEVFPSCVSPLAGPLHLILYTKDAEDKYAGFYRTIPYRLSLGIGVECSFVAQNGMKSFDVGIRVYDGVKVHWYAGRYNHVDGTVEVQTGLTTYEVVGTPGILGHGYTVYSTLKLVVDTLGNKYVRLILNDVTYDVSEYEPYDDTSVGTPQIMVLAVSTAKTAGGIYVYADRFLITQNEPTS